MRWGWMIAGGLILLGIAPLLGLALVGAVAALADCRVHEVFAQPCIILGMDWGGGLYSLGVMGWAFFLTAPLALAGMVLGIGLAIAALVRRARD